MGNPGKRYAETRHNIGFRVVEDFASAEGIEITKEGFSSFWSKGKVAGTDVLFLLPQTYMNLSGEAVREAAAYFRVEPLQMIALHDDLDLFLGRVKLDFDAGSAGHRGIASMIDLLGTKAFWRIRMGIGRPAIKEQVESFVLSPFSSEEAAMAETMVIEAKMVLNQWILKETV